MSKVNQSSGYKQTSFQAWESSINTSYNLKKMILELLSELEDGATDEELERILGTEKSRSARPTRYNLRNKGLVRDSGRRRTTESGREAIVWEITPKDEVDQQRELLAASDVYTQIRTKLKKLSLEELNIFNHMIDAMLSEPYESNQ